MSKLHTAQELRTSIAIILIASGSSQTEADTVAANLVMANLSGHDSHGVGMVPRYVAATLEGGLIPNAKATVTLDAGAIVSVDGGLGYGQVVGAEAMALGIERARAIGSCILSLANAHHLGRIGHFAEMATDAGLVSMHFVNVLARASVAPFGGSDGRFGTNPCAIGIPLAGREPFILDLATSRVAQGKMRVAHNKGDVVEPGLLIDADGRPTTDPGVVVVPQPGSTEALARFGAPSSEAPRFGALLPFGEHKGYGLAVACELLGGALTGGGTWHRVSDGRAQVVNGMLTVLIDPSKLGPQAASFEREALAFVDWLKRSPPQADAAAHGIQIAGDPERRARSERERGGIAIDDATWEEIVAAGKKVGVTPHTTSQ